MATRIHRMRARSLTYLVRAVVSRVWPFSEISRRYYQRRMRPDRWAAANSLAKTEWARNPPDLDARAVQELRTGGIHITDVNTLLGAGFDFAAVKLEAKQLLTSSEIKQQIEHRRSSQGIKWYEIRAFGYKPRRLVPAAIASVVLNERVLGIVNSYLGLNSRIIYLDLWYNLPVADDEPALDSERWHRDGEDKRLILVSF